MTLTQFDEAFVDRLNPQQKEAVHTIDGAVLLLAVPGSGKTTVLVTRLGYMVCCKSIAPQNIMTMTYTVAATVEMKQRFAAMFGPKYASDMEFCTINSLSSQIIKCYANSHGRRQPFPVIENDAAARLVGQIYQQINGEYPTESTIKDIRTGITYIKNMMLSEDEIDKVDVGVNHIAKIYREYCDCLRQAQLMDFDDQMGYALTILKNYPTILDHFQERYRYICVDESQDTSKIQHEIIKLLAKKYGNLFMVGDEDQSIYGFRAAYPQALLNYQSDYPNAKILLMEKNYRSTQDIVAAANVFVAKNRFRYEKKMIPTRSSGKPIQRIYTANRIAQYKYLFQLARSCTRETAVLYRNNDSALPLIDLFERNSVPYNCKKFEDAFFSHRIVTDIIDIIHFAYDPFDAEIFMRIYYKFGSPITKTAAIYACEQSARSGRSILEELTCCPELDSYGRDGAADLCALLPQLPDQSAEMAIAQIWSALRYNSYVTRNKLDAGKYDILCMLAKQEATPQSFLQRLDTLKYLIQNHVNRDENKFILSTVHSSKGLEYERVYLLDILDGILPSKKLSEIKTAEDVQQYEEDRRVYYVAMTRVKDELYLFCCPHRESQFTAEILSTLPAENIDPEDIFSSFMQNLCGRTYTHKHHGKGRIIAHWADQMLVEYAPDHTQLMTLTQMLENRDTTVKYAAVTHRRSIAVSDAEAEYITANIQIGSRVTHKTFGSGVVLAIINGVADIKFDQTGDTKRIMLDITLRNGILR